MQTFIDKYIEQGMQQGIHKILTTPLSCRFGTLPEWAKKKIEEADVVSIEEWSLKLLSASTVDEVFH